MRLFVNTMGMAELTLPSMRNQPYELRVTDECLAYRIWVNGKMDNLNLRIDCSLESGDFFDRDGKLYVEKIHISRDYGKTVLYKGLKLLALICMLDVALFLIWNRSKIRDALYENAYVTAGLICIFMVSSLSLMGDFSVGRADLLFHYSRIVGLAEGLTSGSFPVKIQPGWFFGYGYAVSVCYGDLLLYLPAILYILGVPIMYAYQFYVLIINLGTVLISYFCYKEISKDKYIAVTCAALYCLSMTRLLNVYMRAAVGEYSAFMFLPLVLLGMWRIYAQKAKSFRDGGLILCLGMTGIIQTHVITIEMSCVFLALAVFILIRKMTKHIFMQLLKSAFATLCLNLGFIVPFLDYLTDDLLVFAKRQSYGIQTWGLTLYELLSFSTVAEGGQKLSTTGLYGRIPESLGLAMLLVLLLTAVVVCKCREWEEEHKKEFILSALLSGIALWMATQYFPYNRLAALTGFKNIFASIQFPWRFLSIAVPLMVYMACHVFVKAGQIFGKRWLYCILAGLCLISAFQAMHCMDLLNRSDRENTAYYDFRDMMNRRWIAVEGEYLLTGTDTYQTGLEQEVFGENVSLGNEEKKGVRIEVPCEAGENAYVEFPLFAYRYYQCADTQTKGKFPITRGSNNKVRVELPDHYQGTLRVSFVEPWYWRGSEAVSLATAGWMIIYLCRYKSGKDRDSNKRRLLK